MVGRASLARFKGFLSHYKLGEGKDLFREFCATAALQFPAGGTN